MTAAALQVHRIRSAAQRQYIPMTWVWGWLTETVKVGMIRVVSDMPLDDARHWAIMPWESVPADLRDPIHNLIIQELQG